MKTVTLWSDRTSGAALLVATDLTIVAETPGRLGRRARASWPPIEEVVACDMDLRLAMVHARRAEWQKRRALQAPEEGHADQGAGQEVGNGQGPGALGGEDERP